MLGLKSRQCGVKYWNNREKPVFTLLSWFSDILCIKSKLTIVFSTPFYMYMWLSSAHKIATIYSCSWCEKTVESQLNWLIVPKCGCRIGSLFAIDHIGYDGVAIRRGVLGVWTCISTMRQVIVFKCEVFVWFNWNKLCDIFSAGGRFLRQTRLRANIVCLFFTLSIHIVFLDESLLAGELDLSPGRSMTSILPKKASKKRSLSPHQRCV